MTPKDAHKLMLAAKKQLASYLDDGELDLAENICAEFFNLEPDYIFELLDTKNSSSNKIQLHCDGKGRVRY